MGVVTVSGVDDRLAGLTSWHHDWSGLKVAVLGLGATGFSVADTLVELQSRVRVIYGSQDADRERLLDVIGAERAFADTAEKQIAQLEAFVPDLIVVSPGFPSHHPVLAWASGHGITIWGDIELGWRLRDKTERIADWICITGTNGKTTTTQLTAHMLVAGGLRAVPAGNIGTPILDVLRDPVGYDVIVVELSSFQLERVHTMSPYSSVCLNIADDHLDWHGGSGGYLAAKARVYENTQVACVYNRADLATEQMVEAADVIEGARAVSFGLDTPPPSGFGLIEGILIDRGFHAERRDSAFELVTAEELAGRGLAAPHMVQNILAASALARSRGVEPAEIASAILGFAPDPHRAQQLGSFQGALWVDDSKATNLHAAEASLLAYPTVVWVLGGLFKGVDIAPLVKAHVQRLRAVVVIGADRAETLRILGEHAPGIPVVEVHSVRGLDVMREAARAAAALVQTGDTVLLAPASASMDQFTDYAARGQAFQEALTELRAAESPADPADPAESEH